MTRQHKIFIASTNPGKVAEFSAMLGEQIHWCSLRDFAEIKEIEETGETFAENARAKALGYAEAANLWTLADDSGLQIDALDGAPGVKSARFSGEKTADRGLLDHKNMTKVLKLLKGIPQEKRTARFICYMCLAEKGRVLAEAEGILEGIIAEQEIGTNGFGYDPIFFLPDRKRTVAQLRPEEKNAISHRSRALKKLKKILPDILRHS